MSPVSPPEVLASGPSTVVMDPRSRPLYTLTQETDARTALTRGLKEYLQGVSAATITGRDVRFKSALDQWADPEITASWPALAVYADGPGIYEDSQFSVDASNGELLPDDPGTSRVTKNYLIKTSELAVNVTVDVWCSDRGERTALVAALESALNPVDFMYGVRLNLPHYHGVRGRFELTQQVYEDDENTAKQRIRHAMLVVKGQVPVVVVRKLPLGSPRPVLDAGDSVVLKP